MKNSNNIILGGRSHLLSRYWSGSLQNRFWVSLCEDDNSPILQKPSIFFDPLAEYYWASSEVQLGEVAWQKYRYKHSSPRWRRRTCPRPRCATTGITPPTTTTWTCPTTRTTPPTTCPRIPSSGINYTVVVLRDVRWDCHELKQTLSQLAIPMKIRKSRERISMSFC